MPPPRFVSRRITGAASGLPPRSFVVCLQNHDQAGNRALGARRLRETAKRERGEPTLPSTVAEELATNPFLRCDQPEIISSAERRAGRRLAGRVEVFAVLRDWKNTF